MKKVFLFIFLCMSTTLYAQDMTNATSKDSIRNQFIDFLNHLCSEESDTLLNANDTLSKYKVVFTSQEHFIDPKVRLMRLCNYKDIKKENYIAEVYYLKNVEDSLRSYFRDNSCEAIKTCITNNYWGEPLEDSIINIQSESSCWVSCVCAKEIKFSIEISKNNIFDTYGSESKFMNPTLISYHSGKYLIHDMMLVTQIGNQTDSGHIFTFYLERID